MEKQISDANKKDTVGFYQNWGIVAPVVLTSKHFEICNNKNIK